MNEGNTMNSFASELLHEVKEQSKRWFTAFTIMAFIEIITVISFITYISLPAEDVSIENDTGSATYIGNDLNGEIVHGENTSGEENTQK